MLLASARAGAQAGPPFLTNDPGTPGNGNWEINLAAMPTVARNLSTYQLPQIDINYGIGTRIQLSVEIPYVFATASGAPPASGWGNGNPGLKWRFLDQGEGGWQMSIFPQVETRASQYAERQGIAGPGPRLLVPVEVSRVVGPINVDVEAGYYVGGTGPHERILGLVAGRNLSERLELDVEIYNDRVFDARPAVTTLDIGGRYKFNPHLIGLFMAGRSIDGTSEGQPEFIGYFGIQILLDR